MDALVLISLLEDLQRSKPKRSKRQHKSNNSRSEACEALSETRAAARISWVAYGRWPRRRRDGMGRWEDVKLKWE